MGHWLLLLAFLVSPHAWGEQSTDSTGDYAMDLGQVYGATQAVKFMKEICNESFPNLVEPNDLAYKKWRTRYLPFLQELEKHWTALAWREAKGDPKRHADFLNEMARYFDQYKESLRKQMQRYHQKVCKKVKAMYPFCSN